MPLVIVIAASLTGLGVGVAASRSRAKRAGAEARRRAKAVAAGISKAASVEAGVLRRSAETAARVRALAQRDSLDERLASEQEALEDRSDKLQVREDVMSETWDAIAERKEEGRERDTAVRDRRTLAAELRTAGEECREDLRVVLEEKAQTKREQVVEGMRSGWLEQARADGAQLLRSVEHGAGDASVSREAKRLMSVAVSRYQNHFLIDQSLSNIQIPSSVCDLLRADQNRILDVLAEGANTKLNLHESGASIRLEGLDGVGREVARRALKGLARKPNSVAAAKSDAGLWVATIRERLDTEIIRLGKKAFKVLKVRPAHDEIIGLVGALNYRTSYTQNQWLHAVEASFLAGMMAEELGLDVTLARRATLLHDIGKALTHKIEGSHAVIGAEIARRLGEDEIVANAIGSHHADEPANSAYAYLVAAADAMSGARPGARREQSEGFSTRLEDLERLAGNYRGVEHCAAVHGGRELRVYVRDRDVSDLQAVDMSSKLAAQISEELTFPGQVKVTVIRTTECVAVAL